MKIPIAIVDDSIHHRRLLEEQIGYFDDIRVCFTADDGQDFLTQMQRLPPNLHPLVVLMDIEMPEMKGTEAVKQARQIYPEVRFLMLTVFDDDEKIFEAITNGASGYLLKDEKTSTIIEHIRQLVDLGGAPMSPSIARKALDLLSRLGGSAATKKEPNAEIPGMLSKREKEVLELLVGGKDYKAIAEKLFVSNNTVRTHIANIYEKLHVSSKTQVVTMAIQRKWFDK
jgi:DNA-binding NarL/FixJ family response regulator